MLKHRAFRCYLLPRKRAKGYPLQSLALSRSSAMPPTYRPNPTHHHTYHLYICTPAAPKHPYSVKNQPQAAPTHHAQPFTTTQAPHKHQYPALNLPKQASQYQYYPSHKTYHTPHTQYQISQHYFILSLLLYHHSQ